MLCGYLGSQFGNFVRGVDIGFGETQSLHREGFFLVITLDGVED